MLFIVESWVELNSQYTSLWRSVDTWSKADRTNEQYYEFRPLSGYGSSPWATANSMGDEKLQATPIVCSVRKRLLETKMISMGLLRLRNNEARMCLCRGVGIGVCSITIRSITRKRLHTESTTCRNKNRKIVTQNLIAIHTNFARRVTIFFCNKCPFFSYLLYGGCHRK